MVKLRLGIFIKFVLKEHFFTFLLLRSILIDTSSPRPCSGGRPGLNASAAGAALTAAFRRWWKSRVNRTTFCNATASKRNEYVDKKNWSESFEMLKLSSNISIQKCQRDQICFPLYLQGIDCDLGDSLLIWNKKNLCQNSS